MPFYIAEYTGTGRGLTPFRPFGWEQPGWAAIDLRPDPSRQDGGGLSAALLWLSVAQSAPQLQLLAQDKLEQISAAAINSRLGTSVSAGRFADVIAQLLLNPPVNGWKPIRHNRIKGRYEIYLGDLLWSQPVVAGASALATDDFNRSDSSTLGGNWTTFGAGSYLSLGITSNTCGVKTDDFDSGNYYSAISWPDDQYAQMVYLHTSAGHNKVGVRLSTAAADNGYFAGDTFANLGHRRPSIVKLASGTWSELMDPGGGALAANDVVYLQAQGTTLIVKVNGSQRGTNLTDSSYASGAAGLFANTNPAASALDNFEGGDFASPLFVDYSTFPIEKLRPHARTGRF